MASTGLDSVLQLRQPWSPIDNLKRQQGVGGGSEALASTSQWGAGGDAMTPQLTLRGTVTGLLDGLGEEGGRKEKEGGRKEFVCVKNEKIAPSQHELGDVGLPCCRGTCHLVMQVVKNSKNIVSKTNSLGWFKRSLWRSSAQLLQKEV